MHKRSGRGVATQVVFREAKQTEREGDAKEEAEHESKEDRNRKEADDDGDVARGVSSLKCGPLRL